jgi:hypothetical protein
MLHPINGYLLVNQQIIVYILDMESKRLEELSNLTDREERSMSTLASSNLEVRLSF